MNLDDLRPNSHEYRARQEKKSIEDYHAPDLSGKGVKIQKKSPARKLLETFITYDAEDIRSYVIGEILVPKVKNMMYEIGDGILGKLFGTGAVKKTTTTNKTYVSYNDYYGGVDKKKGATEEKHNIDDLIFETKEEADAVLEELLNVLDQYQMVRVADLYSMVRMNVRREYTDNNWGWTSLGGAKIIPLNNGKDGYLLRLPRPKTL